MSNQVFRQNLDDKKGPQPGGPYLIQMLFKEPVDMPDKDEMTAVMKKHIGAVECFCRDKKMAGFAALDHIAEFQDGKCPVQLMVMGCDKFKGKGFDAFLMSQMWDCREDRERIFRECRYQVVATDMLAAALPALERANLDADFVEALAVMYPTCEAFYFQNCGKLFLAEDVTSRYTRRSDREYDKIANYIHQTVSQRHGNYMVFFPSHVFLQQVYERYLRCYAVKDDTECLVQTEHMDEAEREAFLQRFEGNPGMDLSDIIHMEIEVEEESSLVGFCVLGGIFSEGIDLKEDSLIGALIVGTGLPQVCTEREIIRGYFEENGENGFDYAYRYPGMNKVLQAAGRVIRTADDVGIVALLDDRFLTPGYRRLFPREWEQFEVVRGESIGSRVEKFWNDWL